MRESIGSTFLYNIIIIFIVIIFGILAATLTYYKAFKVNTRIITSIEKFEGYNSLAITEIQNTLTTVGYMFKEEHKCPSTKDGGVLQTEDKKFRYCVYYFDSSKEGTKYYSYGVITYITIDFPIVNLYLQIPIYTKSNRIYKFNG
ncbi:MAG: hypothetical protein E7169_04325 [Firmicutes bacterium]|nr:hypothetical protein [Bacillota bacterium]